MNSPALNRSAKRENLLLLGLTLTLLAVLLYVPPRWADWNQNSRLDLMLAVSREGRLPIDTFHVNTGDKARIGGHFYSDQSIGVGLLALPIVAIADRITGLPPLAAALARAGSAAGFRDTLRPGGSGVAVDKVRFFTALYAATVFAVVLPSILLCRLIFVTLRPLLPAPEARLLVTLAYALGTPAVAYSAALYGHQPAAAALFAAFTILFHNGRPERIGRRRMIMAGLFLGLAALCDYSALCAFPALLWYMVRRQSETSDALFGGAAALAGFVPQTVYNTRAFGFPSNTGHRYTEVFRSYPIVLRLPALDTLYGLLFSPYRGLFFRAPLLLLGFAGLALWRPQGRETCGERDARRVCLAVVLCFLLYNLCVPMWWGGSSVGPRHLLPAVPFLLPPLAVFLRVWAYDDAPPPPQKRMRLLLFGAVAALGAVLCIGEAWAGQFFPPDLPGTTWWSVTVPEWRRGDIARNIGMALGGQGASSLLPLAVLMVVIWGFIALRLRQTSARDA